MSAHTPGPWVLGEYDEHLGYDCMTGGIRVGPVVIDGSDYGQLRCSGKPPPIFSRMMADAHLIATAPELLAALRRLIAVDDAHADLHAPDGDDIKRMIEHAEAHKHARAVVIKALGGST